MNGILDILKIQALNLLSERENAKGLLLPHVAIDLLPSTRKRVFKFFAARRDAPNRPNLQIALDESGSPIDQAALERQEGVKLFTSGEWSVDRERLWRFGAADALFTIDPPANDLTLNPGEPTAGFTTVTVRDPGVGTAACQPA